MTDNIKLDTLTQSVRFVGAVAPKVVTRVALGASYVVEDVVTDPAVQLLAFRTASGIGFVGSKIPKISFGSAKDGMSKIGNIPGLGKAVAFAKQAGSEVKGAWDNAGLAEIELQVHVSTPAAIANDPSVEAAPDYDDPQYVD